MRDIDANNKSLQRDTEDAQADLDAEQGKIMQELGNKVMAVSRSSLPPTAIALVLDVSNPQTPVLWAASAIDITSRIVKLYDQAHPGTGAAPSAAKPPRRHGRSGTSRPQPRLRPPRRLRRRSKTSSRAERSLRPILDIQRYNSVRGYPMRALAVVLSR